ncbi:hypothetical protein FKP32DRAFT_1543130, partial [Trametes sanguinea]
DSRDWSCGYDALLTLMWNVRLDEDDHWVRGIASENVLSMSLFTRLTSLPEVTSELERERDHLRDALSMMDPVRFVRRGRSMVAFSDILETVFRTVTPFCASVVDCSSCGLQTEHVTDMCVSLMWTILPANIPNFRAGKSQSYPSQLAVNSLLSAGLSVHCAACRLQNAVRTTVLEAPPLLFLDVGTVSSNIRPDCVLQLPTMAEPAVYNLRGIVYHGYEHFTSRYIDRNGTVWFHDGASSGQFCIKEG